MISVGFFIYVSIYYHADEAAAAAMGSDDRVTVARKDGMLVFSPEEAEYGFIFYPGGKVEYTAYAPLMRKLAEKNILCVVPEMPFNLAVFGQDKAAGIADGFPQIKHWYIGGHSLGGAMAAVYAGKNPASLDGLVLLAAFSTSDLRDSGLSVLSVYGSNDKVLDMDKYESYKKNLPSGFREYVIQGGCHAYFGSYGRQNGDGEPDITPEEQWDQTANIISDFFGVGAVTPTLFYGADENLLFQKNSDIPQRFLISSIQLPNRDNIIQT